MKTVDIRGQRIGDGTTKICVPITGRNREQIMDQAGAIRASGADMAEWRADWYEDVDYDDCVVDCLRELREILGDIILLFTFRTMDEGGVRTITQMRYIDLNLLAASTGDVDLIDVEMSRGEIDCRYIVEETHAYNVKVIGSSHDFEHTDTKESLLYKLKRMDRLGADILKVAVMPQNAVDVLVLLEVTEEAQEIGKPLITMSMGRKGLVSRLTGELFGSAVTFGCIGQASAPGQIEVSRLRQVMNLFHETNIEKFRDCLKSEKVFPYNIFLTGFMGTGKTTLSNYLADQLPLKELDMDAQIVENEGMSINDIFAEKGEPYFRGLETQLLIDLQQQEHLLVSCGGGVVLRDENVVEMKKNGVVVLLTAKAETILERVKDDDSRPLLRGNKNTEFIQGMLDVRGPKYMNAADIIIETDGKTTESIAEELCGKLLGSDFKGRTTDV